MKENPASSSAFRFAAESIPASATTTMSPHAVALRERAQHREQGGGLGGVALEQVHLEREPGRVDQEPDLDLRVDAVLLAHPDLAQLVLVVASRSAASSVVEHQRGGAAVRTEWAQAAVASCPR